jgi:ECF transporter S component (folate family)
VYLQRYEVPFGRGVAKWTKRDFPCGADFASRCCIIEAVPPYVANFALKEVVCMKNLFETFQSSAKELKKPVTVAITAMLLALNMAIKSFTIPVGSFMKIGFSFLTNAVCGMLYGPIAAGLMAGVGDIIGYMMNPMGQPWFPGFTLNAVLAGMIYGVFFYKKKITFARALTAKVLVSVVVNVILGTLWLYILYGPGMLTALPIRAIKELIKCPVDAALIYFCAKVLQRVYSPNRTGSGASFS